MKKLLLSAMLCCCTILIFAQGKATTHKIAKGETLSAIARKYHTTVAAILKANNISADAKLKLGQNLTIPATPAQAETKPATTKADPAKTEKPKTSTAAAKPAADSKPAAKATADKKATTTANATKPAKPAVRAAGDNPSSHTVGKGETLYSLARVYGVSVRHLREANNMSDDVALRVGQKLNIPSKNPEADYKPVMTEAKPVEKAPAKPEAGEPGREYLASDNTPMEKPEKKTEEPVKATPTPVKVSEEKPSTPAVTDKPKEMVKEEKAPEPKETKPQPVETARSTNVAPSDYANVFSGYGSAGKRKIVYRGIGSFLKSENPGNQYLALYNYADMGAILKVTNLMSKQAIYVKVIGKVPAADAQNEIILKVSGEAASQLKVAEDKFLVEVTGYNE